MIKTHNISVDNYSITPETIDVGTKGSYGNEQLNLTLSKQWDDLIVKISFFPPNHVPMVVIYSGEPIPIPAESTRNGGTTQYMISGHTSGRVIKSLIGRLNVLNTLDTATTPPNSPTPTEMEQVYDWMREAVDMANSVRQDADGGLFNGEDGVNGIDGVDGTDGKSAYESAVDGGYPDTEQKFNTDLAEVSIKADEAEASANRAGEYKDKIVNMDVTAETLAPEQPATVEITETESNIEMVLGIPKGKDGTDGEQGIQGTQGERGEDGKDGTDGRDGIDGVNGVDGVTPVFTVGAVTKGEEPQVSITGTAANPVFNAVLPKGDTGETGGKGDTGAKGDKGDKGNNGADGKSVELQTTASYIQWRNIGDSAWQNVVELSTLKGSDGSDGVDGKSIELQVTETHIQWRQSDGAWQNLILLSSLKGKDGADGIDGIDGVNGVNGIDGTDGKEIDLSVTATHIAWRYTGEETWNNLIALSELQGDTGATGADGREIELNKSDTHLQWRYYGGGSWIDIVALTEITGQRGEQGIQGIQGIQGERGKDGSDFTVLGYYATISALEAAVPNPNAGNAYGVGNEAPYDIYIWDVVNDEWKNNGTIQGAKGEQGIQGVQGETGERGLPGKDGSDATVTNANVINAIGYTPANETGVIDTGSTSDGTAFSIEETNSSQRAAIFLKSGGERAGFFWYGNNHPSGYGGKLRIHLDAKSDVLFTNVNDMLVDGKEVYHEGNLPEYPTALPADGGDADTVNGKTVAENVPAGAKFTDTITTINGKTGTIAKADIVALGIPAQDTVYTHPTTHSISEVSGLQTALDGKVDDSQVLTNVPLNAKFTDTVYSHPSSHPASMITESSTERFVSDSEKLTWNSKPDTDTVTTINGKTGAISKADIVALGIPSTDTNTTYTEITTAEIDTGTSSDLRTITARRLKYLLDKIVNMFPSKTSDLNNDSGFLTSVSKTDVGLGNVDNTSDLNKPISTATQTALDTKVDNSKVLTDVPLNAKFTDTITTINSKTGVITKADIVALGIPSADTNTITTINGKTGAIAKSDITALGIPAQDTDTTYTEITTAEIDAGTASTLRTITARRLKYLLDKIVALFPSKTSELTNDSGFLTSVTKSDVGLGNVDNIKQMPISNGVLENYREKLTTLTGTSTAINLSLCNVFTHTLTGNTTYSITNAVNGQAHSFTLIINMGSTVRTLTFPASVKWQDGEIPDMSTANKTYVLTFVTVNGGTTWLGMFGGEF